MSQLVSNEDWVWVVVQYSPAGEQVVGQQMEDDGVAFIPAFLKKETAEKSYKKLALEDAPHYEVQAIEYQELVKVALAGGFQIFILNETGEILEKNTP